MRIWPDVIFTPKRLSMSPEFGSMSIAPLPVRLKLQPAAAHSILLPSNTVALLVTAAPSTLKLPSRGNDTGRLVGARTEDTPKKTNAAQTKNRCGVSVGAAINILVCTAAIIMRRK